MVYIFTIPILWRNKVVEEREFEKFIDVRNYMEQILYSFRRHSKIGVALEDTIQIFPEGTMREMILHAVDHINESYTIGNTYEEALGMIEEVYPCEMLLRIHSFVVSVELLGGRHKKGIDLLIQDSSKWSNRVMGVKNGKKP